MARLVDGQHYFASNRLCHRRRCGTHYSGPVLIPIMDLLGVNLVHFGVVMVVNLAIGTIHPPVGNCLYIVSAISGESIARCSIAVIPVVGVMIAALMLITFVPELVLFVPRYFGY